MNCKSKLAALGLVAVVGVATPAFAQALQTGSAANREQLYGSSPSHQFAPYYGRQTDRANGLGAYAEAASRSAVAQPGPAPMAGGSIGYNSHNETHN
jgi:hypothetical protein